VHLTGPDEKGQMQRWAIEWAAAGQLNGITRETLKPGDHVIVSGNPGRTAADHRLRMRSILRPKDGFKWSGDFQ
jgi:thiamine monophosphate kinase